MLFLLFAFFCGLSAFLLVTAGYHVAVLPLPLLRSLAADHFSDRSSHLPLRTLHQAIASAPNCLDPLRHHPWPGGMREAIKSGHRALGATVGAVWCHTIPLTKIHPRASLRICPPAACLC